MKFFIKNLSKFIFISIFPFLILILIYIIFDPFKVIYHYENYYENLSNGFVGLNRGHVSTMTLNNITKKDKLKEPDSYILGNSKSIFFQESEWKKYLPETCKCYHFDGSGDPIWVIEKRISYLQSNNFKISNALIILDYFTLSQSVPAEKEIHLSIISPELVNNKNLFKFHFIFFKSFISFKFLYAYFDFMLNKEVKGYMKEQFLLDDRAFEYSINSNEIRYDYFEDLINNNKYFNKERIKVFPLRPSEQTIYEPIIKTKQIEILKSIAMILKNKNTNFRIIISPVFDQKKLNYKDLATLNLIFGNENVFDFSGKNELTEDYKNFYDSYHYRPVVANWILKRVYSKK